MKRKIIKATPLQITAWSLAGLTLGAGLVYFNFIEKDKFQTLSIGAECPNFLVKTYVCENGSFDYSAEFFNLYKNKGKVGDLLNAIYRELKELPKYEPYPIEYEKKLQEAIVSGNENVAREYLNKLLGEIFFRSSGDFNVIKARVLELIVLLSRSAIEGGADSEQIFALNNGYIEEINKYDTTEKLGLWLSGIINRFIGYMFEFGDVRHSLTLRKIVMYIKSNYMRKLTLDDIADYVMLSKSHVSKIFNEEMQMSLSAYVNKVRIEKSKRLMADGALSVAQIAELVGFEEQGYFTKQFKAETGLSPKIFREKLGVIIQ